MANVGADQTVLDFNDIDNAISKAVAIKTFKGQSLSPTTERIRQSMTAEKSTNGRCSIRRSSTPRKASIP
jgi:hypothetical protein